MVNCSPTGLALPRIVQARLGRCPRAAVDRQGATQEAVVAGDDSDVLLMLAGIEYEGIKVGSQAFRPPFSKFRPYGSASLVR